MSKCFPIAGQSPPFLGHLEAPEDPTAIASASSLQVQYLYLLSLLEETHWNLNKTLIISASLHNFSGSSSSPWAFSTWPHELATDGRNISQGGDTTDPYTNTIVTTITKGIRSSYWMHTIEALHKPRSMANPQSKRGRVDTKSPSNLSSTTLRGTSLRAALNKLVKVNFTSFPQQHTYQKRRKARINHKVMAQDQASSTATQWKYETKIVIK